MLVINNLSFSYGNNLVIDNFSLAVANDEIVAVIGKSGCGKTTLLNNCATIYGENNSILLNNKVLSAKEKNIGLLMQDFGLLPWLNVRDNCLLPYTIKKLTINKKVEKHFEEILNKLDIKQLIQTKVTKLSGGQKQRVALARLFTFSPDLILLDEAFSSLDIFTKEEAIKLFFNLWESRQVPTLLVTHNIDEALYIAKTIVIVEKNCHIKEIIDNPLFMNDNYRQDQQYGYLYKKVANLIKGEH